ncbi:hypothetical protein SAMN02745121_07880 [Nannocystis exedens]|uniref:SMI1 / KNR4 family (SUKH-1) n=1 Tax=Nannocystis exedens TaxID=54 RepID=A0A1I2HFF1_9BACT|nr:hypothetical protein [Nannocystis exedens]PCC67844.1 hypothetical protein NAEX_00852 [Nannocystis exedens]SFF27647.1 hypothetical protein SAMN02745121_07880 [Nannocystis exedens]
MHALESHFERFITRLVPGIEHSWQGATPEEIAEIESIAGRALPGFYWWFLTRMGRDMGDLTFASMDFTAARVIECYREEIDEPDLRYLLIGYQNDPMVPMHTWYDLDRPNREDALVLDREIAGGLTQVNFETFREMLAWKAMLNFRIEALPHGCKGKFKSDGADVRARLERAVETLNFEQPVPTGPFCGIFNRSDAAMICSIGPDSTVKNRLIFRLAADSEGIARRILGVITKETGLEVELGTSKR